jgi:hypothetical protein
MGQHRSSCWQLELHKERELEPHMVQVLELHMVLELHRSKELEQRHRCKPSCGSATEPGDLLAWLQEHMDRKQVLGLVRKLRLPVRCTRLCVHADGSRALLAWQQEHKRVLHRRQEREHKLVLVLVRSRKQQPRHYNPSCG